MDYQDRSKPTQLHIAGTERVTDTKIEQCAVELREADDACKRATEHKNDRLDALIYAMQNAGVTRYKYVDDDGRQWTIKATTKLGAKIVRGHGED